MKYCINCGNKSFKKLLCCFLIIVLMLAPLTGCSSEKDKFVGEYTRYYGTLFYGVETQYGNKRVYKDCIVNGTQNLILNKDGTGKVEFVDIKYADNIEFDEDTIKKIKKQLSKEVVWEVIDGYLSINFDGVSYYEDGVYKGVERKTNTTKTYELKGNVLIEIGNENEYYKYKKVK